VRVETDRSGRVTVSANSTLMPAFFALCGLGTLILAISMWLRGNAETGKLIGASISAAMFLGAGAVFYERSRFVFDPGTRTVGWSRRRLNSEKSGRLSFDQITGVVLQRSSSERNATQRIALETTAGELPVTIAYGGSDQHLADVAQAIKAVLGQHGDLSDDSIRAALAAGRKIEAIAMARTIHGLDLTDAKKLVDRMAAGANQPKP
jgi:hypothetical protein